MPFSDDAAILQDLNIQSVLDFNSFLQSVQPVLTEQAGFRSVETSDVVDPAELKGLTTTEKQRISTTLDTLKRIQAGETQFTEKGTGRGIQVDPNNKIAFYHPGWTGLEAVVDYTPQVNAMQDIVESTVRKAKGEFTYDPSTATLQRTTTKLEKTPERQAMEDRFKALSEVELTSLEEQAKYLQSPEYQESLQKQRELEASQQEILGLQTERQRKALAGELEPSDALQTKIQEQYEQFKEAQGRRGNVILGDTLETATAKGTAAEQSLGRFQTTAESLREQERQAIISGENPLLQQGLALSSGLTGAAGQIGLMGQFLGATPAARGALPQAADTGQLSNLFLGAQQPHQLQQQILLQQQMQAQQASAASKQRQSGLLGAGIGALGSIAGGVLGSFGGPAGTMIGSQLGGQLARQLAPQVGSQRTGSTLFPGQQLHY